METLGSQPVLEQEMSHQRLLEGEPTVKLQALTST